MSASDMTARQGYVCPSDNAVATIVAGQSLSSAVNLGGLRVFAVAVAAGFTGTTLTYQFSPDNGTTWLNLQDDSGSEITTTVSAGAGNVVAIPSFAHIGLLKVRSGTSGAPVAQAAKADVMLILRQV